MSLGRMPAAVLILVVCAAAAPKDTTKALSVDQFVSLYVDLALVAEQFLDDSAKLAAAQDSVFEEHGVTREQFDAFRKMMDSKPEKWTDVWERIVKRLEELDKGSSLESGKSPKSSKEGK